MSDEEIQGLLDSAGYTFDPSSGMYQTADDPGGDGKDPDAVADDLSIPLDELLSWQSRIGEAPAAE